MATNEELEKFNMNVGILKNRFNPAQFQTAFELEDKDKSGFLEPNEIKKIVKDILCNLFHDDLDFDLKSEEGQKLMDDKVTEILKQFDENGDGKLELIEFKKLMLLVLIAMIPKLFGYELETFVDLTKQAKEKGKLAKENQPICQEICRAIAKSFKPHS